jgi:hypothetical protein
MSVLVYIIICFYLQSPASIRKSPMMVGRFPWCVSSTFYIIHSDVVSGDLHCECHTLQHVQGIRNSTIQNCLLKKNIYIYEYNWNNIKTVKFCASIVIMKRCTFPIKLIYKLGSILEQVYTVHVLWRCLS